MTMVKNNPQVLAEYLGVRKQAMMQIAGGRIDPDRVIKATVLYCIRNPVLFNVTPASIMECVMTGLELGLVPGISGQLHIVPFKSQDGLKAVPIIGYGGYLRLIYRNPKVQSAIVRPVFEGDEFEIAFGIEDKLYHVPLGRWIPEQLKGVYCLIRFKDGGHLLVWTPRDDIERSRAASKMKHVWDQWFIPMALKTGVLRAYRWLPYDDVLVDVALATEETDTEALLAAEESQTAAKEEAVMGKVTQKVRGKEGETAEGQETQGLFEEAQEEEG